MPAQVFREYQATGTRRILEAFAGGASRVLAVLPTGGGKTTIYAHILSQIRAPALVNVHRHELAHQGANRLREFGADFGMIMPGEPARPSARIQIAMVQTLARRKLVPPANLIINDEAHLSTAATWEAILAKYPKAKILGLTATPWRLGGKPLAKAYDEVVVIAEPHELREQGHLCPYAGFSYLSPDLSQVAVVGGEYKETDSARVMGEPAIVANIVEQWQRHAAHLSTLVFACTVEHSRLLAEQFRAAGVTAEHLDGTTPKGDRERMLRNIANGTTRVLCNVGVAIEGLDVPRIKCVVLARPTKSLARCLQMIGRGRRPWNGQTLRIHDHAFLLRQHGLPDDVRDCRLDAKKDRPAEVSVCVQCMANYRGNECPNCNLAAPVEGLATERKELLGAADGEIVEFDSSTTELRPEVEALPDAWKPPVKLRWERPGRVIEGTYLGVETEQAEWGPRKFYTVQGAERTYSLPGFRHLDSLMSKVKPLARVRIAYLGDQPLPQGRHRKIARVEVDDGQ